MTAKKAALIALAAVAVLLTATFAYRLYWSYNPRLVVYRKVGYGEVYGSGADDRNERLVVGFKDLRAPIAESVKEKSDELIYWVIGIDDELFRSSYYVPPYDLKVFGENEDGKVTLRYEGYVTTQDGERVEYIREGTFDIDFIRPEDFMIDWKEYKPF